MKPVLINPHHVKNQKELDDDNPTKNDSVRSESYSRISWEGRYMIPYICRMVFMLILEQHQT